MTNQNESNSVGLVMQLNFSNKLLDLIEQMPVWIANSSENDKFSKDILNKGHSLTTFEIKSGEALEQAFERIVLSMDYHYNDSSQDVGYKKLLVIGVSLANVSLKPLILLGFSKFEITSDGFFAMK